MSTPFVYVGTWTIKDGRLDAAREFLARHTDSTSKEIGHRACHSCRCTREELVQSGPLEMEIGSRLGRPVAMCSMLLFRQ